MKTFIIYSENNKNSKLAMGILANYAAKAIGMSNVVQLRDAFELKISSYDEIERMEQLGAEKINPEEDALFVVSKHVPDFYYKNFKIIHLFVPDAVCVNYHENLTFETAPIQLDDHDKIITNNIYRMAVPEQHTETQNVSTIVNAYIFINQKFKEHIIKSSSMELTQKMYNNLPYFIRCMDLYAARKNYVNINSENPNVDAIVRDTKRIYSWLQIVTNGLRNGNWLTNLDNCMDDKFIDDFIDMAKFYMEAIQYIDVEAFFHSQVDTKNIFGTECLVSEVYIVNIVNLSKLSKIFKDQIIVVYSMKNESYVYDVYVPERKLGNMERYIEYLKENSIISGLFHLGNYIHFSSKEIL